MELTERTALLGGQCNEVPASRADRAVKTSGNTRAEPAYTVCGPTDERLMTLQPA